MNKYGSRKFLLAVASLGVNAWLLVEALITPADYKALIIATVAVYIAGNVTQKAVIKNDTAAVQ